VLLGLDFPGIDHIVKTRPIFSIGSFHFNKIALICLIAAASTLILFLIAGAKGEMVPKGVQNAVEAGVDFIENGIILEVMGESGLGWLPYLTSLFFFIFFVNISEVLPLFQVPAPARMAIPLVLALLTWVIFIGVGIKHQGAHYFKEALFPPGVPTALYILVTPIELLSTFIVRPFSLAVRLFANMLAGHILLVTFAVLTEALFRARWFLPISAVTFTAFVAFTAFEILVSVLQAYIFTILTAVYIGGAMHPEH